jgi:hypothetical protein
MIGKVGGPGGSLLSLLPTWRSRIKATSNPTAASTMGTLMVRPRISICIDILIEDKTMKIPLEQANAMDGSDIRGLQMDASFQLGSGNHIRGGSTMQKAIDYPSLGNLSGILRNKTKFSEDDTEL